MPTSKQEPPKTSLAGIRDRIVEFRRVPGHELRANPKNWRTHPYAQRLAIQESLKKVGLADVLLAYYSERAGGDLTLIDGHARLEEEGGVDWPTVILDVTDDEADLLLLTLDPMTAMADRDQDLLNELLQDVGGLGTPALEDMLRELAGQNEEEFAGQMGELNPVPEMELQAFEHHDYVLLLFDDARDWSRAKDLLEIEDEAFTLRDGKTRKVGLGRVVDGRRLFKLVDGE